MNKPEDDSLIKNLIKRADSEPENNVLRAPAEIVAKTLSNLPPKTLQKLLIAEHEAQASGDHRSILDPAKLVTLFEKADPEYLASVKAQVRDNPARRVAESELKAILNDPEKLADQILEAAGIQDRRGLMSDDLRAHYPNMNKAALVKLGTENLRNMLFAFIQSNDPLDNRTNIAKFHSYMKQIARGEKPGAAPMGEDNVIKDFKQGPK